MPHGGLLPLREAFLNQIVYHVAVFRMHHHQRADLSRLQQHPEQTPVIHHVAAGVGEIELEAGDTLFDQLWHLLLQNALGHVGDTDV